MMSRHNYGSEFEPGRDAVDWGGGPSPWGGGSVSVGGPSAWTAAQAQKVSTINSIDNVRGWRRRSSDNGARVSFSRPYVAAFRPLPTVIT